MSKIVMILYLVTFLLTLLNPALEMIEDSTFLAEDKSELIEQLLSEEMSEVAEILSETMFSDQQMTIYIQFLLKKYDHNEDTTVDLILFRHLLFPSFNKN